MATTIIDRADVGRRFWLRWVIATTIGSTIGGAMSGALVLAAEYRFADVASPMLGAIALAVTEAVAFGVRGAVVGIAQWVVLRQSIARSGGWVVVTTAGWAVAGIISGVLAGAFGGALTGVGPDYGSVGVAIAFAGGIAFLLIPGTLQWLVLRRQVGRAGWWVLAQAVSFLVAIAFAFPVMVVVGGAVGWEFPSAEAWSLSGALAGLIDGAMTGAVLVWLLRPYISETPKGGVS